MKTIVLVRHSNAEEGDYHLNDFDRRLTFKGVQKAEKIAAMCTGFYQPDNVLFYSSKAPRAHQTAELFAKTLMLKRDSLKTSDFLYFCFSPKELLKDLMQFNRYDTVWVFGHNPMMHELYEYFTGNNTRNYPKCMVAAISFDKDSFDKITERSGKTIFIINPKLL